MSEHSHTCSLYDSGYDHVRVAAAFVRFGLGRNDQCIYLIDDSAVERARHALRGEQIDLDQSLESRALMLMTPQQVPLKGDIFDLYRMSLFWKRAAGAARAQGFGALRAVADSEPLTRAAVNSNGWLEYESKLTQLAQEGAGSFLCQYERQLFMPRASQGATQRSGLELRTGPDKRRQHFGLELASAPVLVLHPLGDEAETVLDLDVGPRENVQGKLLRNAMTVTEGQRISHTGSWAFYIRLGEFSWSEEVFHIFGLDPDQDPPSYQAVFEQVHWEDRPLVRNRLEAAVRQRTDYEQEFRILRPGGDIRHVSVLAHPVRDENGALVEFVGSIIDVTEQRYAERVLQATQAELARMSRVLTLGELTASIAHEVRQPLSAIVLSCNAALRWLGGSTPNIEESRIALGRCIESARRASQVIGRIRAMTTKAERENEILDMNDSIREILLLMGEELGRRRVSVITQFDETLPMVMGDRVQLQQVILNLLMNAIESIEAREGGRRQLTVRTDRTDDGGAQVSIKDSGVGLEPALLESIFRPFYTTKPHGVGIGLSISSSIIEAHHGRLWAALNAGEEGVTFHLTLPPQKGRLGNPGCDSPGEGNQ